MPENFLRETGGKSIIFATGAVNQPAGGIRHLFREWLKAVTGR